LSLRSLLAALAVCLAVPAVAQTKINLGYTQSNAFMAAFVAKGQGFFAKRGLDFTMQIVPQGSTIASAMAGGTLTAGTLTPPAFLLAVVPVEPFIIQQGQVGYVVAVPTITDSFLESASPCQ
jgi:ABC-type nitrate/sulfonate/bicarbonate transport system substrate-binding protein